MAPQGKLLGSKTTVAGLLTALCMDQSSLCMVLVSDTMGGSLCLLQNTLLVLCWNLAVCVPGQAGKSHPGGAACLESEYGMSMLLCLGLLN